MYSFDSRVRYSEVDEDRKLSLTGAINYLQDCSTFQSEDLNQGIDYLTKKHRAWLLSSWQIIVDRYPKLGEQIVVSTWPYDFKGIYGFFFDTEPGCPLGVGEEDVAAYGIGQEEKLPMDYAPRRIPVPAEYEECPVIAVATHHIDTNHHVNNAQYVEIAREVLPAGICIRELRVEYKKEAVLGDQIIPRVSVEAGCYTIALCDTEGKPYAIVWLRSYCSE